ncbi:cystathionine beta-synthase [Coccidioides immitis RMSCC 3703]|uniref:Cystathionine beta-synthase n=1 Tax=Coccidioides immitis RMSCC 3703 TaxID=454286 RepID=A0A0J8R691_COCIT|nr:cystathionine beta-synthase [Coccidioides immitis RMSCC 3703]
MPGNIQESTAMTQYLGQPLSESITEHIGATPLVRLNRLPASFGIKAKVCAKLEYFNAGGSVKDRIAKRMVEQAEQDGLIKPGDTLIEASSGNTGIAIALMAAIKGYKCIITLSEKMSLEKEQILHALGARVINTSSRKIPRAHELGPAEEIWHQTQGKVNAVVAGAGTGGTITGMARAFKKKNRGVFVVGVDPVGSVLAQPAALNGKKSEYKIEGIGYDFVPGVLDQAAPDLWVKTTDKESFQMARQLVSQEGILCGGSSGAAFAGLRQFLEIHPEFNVEDKTIVLVLADNLRNYLTKFGDDAWMESNGYGLDLTP